MTLLAGARGLADELAGTAVAARLQASVIRPLEAEAGPASTKRSARKKAGRSA